METTVAELELIIGSVCENVGADVFLFITFARDTGALYLPNGRVLRAYGICEGYSYLTARHTAKGHLGAVRRLDLESCHNGRPRSVVVHLYLGIVASGSLAAVVEGIERHRVEIVRSLERDLKRIGIGSCVVHGVSRRLITVKRILEVRNCRIVVYFAAGQRELIVGCAKKDIGNCRLCADDLVAGTGHLTDTDVVAAKRLI